LPWSSGFSRAGIYDECKLAARKELDLFLVDGMDVLLDKANGKNGSIPQPVKTMKIGKVFSAPASKVTVDIIAALSRLILTAGIIYIAYKVTLHLGT